MISLIYKPTFQIKIFLKFSWKFIYATIYTNLDPICLLFTVSNFFGEKSNNIEGFLYFLSSLFDVIIMTQITSIDEPLEFF